MLTHKLTFYSLVPKTCNLKHIHHQLNKQKTRTVDMDEWITESVQYIPIQEKNIVFLFLHACICAVAFSGMCKCSYCKNGWLPVALLSKWLYSSLRKENSLNADVFTLNTPTRHKVCVHSRQSNRSKISHQHFLTENWLEGVKHNYIWYDMNYSDYCG